jgi:hypothetical protein
MMVRLTEVTPADEARIVDIICGQIDIVQERLTSDAGRQALERGLYDLLHRGALPVAAVLAWARAGHPAADAAVRRYAYELWHARQQLSPDVEAYAMGVVIEPIIPKYPPGHVKTVDTWVRDIGIAILVKLCAEGTGLPATRSRTTTAPSAAFFVSKALKRKGHKLKEQAVNRIHWAQDKLAARLEAVMPALPSPF